MSVRTSTVGPSPFLNTPTMPVPPTFSVTSKPNAFSSFAMRSAVLTSCSDSSGLVCRCL